MHEDTYNIDYINMITAYNLDKYRMIKIFKGMTVGNIYPKNIDLRHPSVKLLC